MMALQGPHPYCRAIYWCKKLSDNQQEYNDVHGFYCAGVERLFARLWHWKIVHNVWLGSARDLHQHVRVLLHLTQFCIRRQTRYRPYGGNVSAGCAPGIFLDPYPTGGLLGGALRGRT